MTISDNIKDTNLDYMRGYTKKQKGLSLSPNPLNSLERETEFEISSNLKCYK